MKRYAIKRNSRVAAPVGIAEHPVTDRFSGFAESIFDRIDRRKAQVARDARTVNAVIAQIGVFIRDGNFDFRKVTYAPDPPSRAFDNFHRRR